MKRCTSALAASLLLALTGGVTNAYADGGPLAPVTAPVTQPAELAAPLAPAAPAAEQPAVPASQSAPASQPAAKPTETTSTSSNSPLNGQSQTAPRGSNNGGPSQDNDATQVSVPVASPATQVTAGNNVQVATLGSQNGDVENNNQSQELEQSNESNGSGQTPQPRSGDACCTTNHSGNGKSPSGSEGQENEATQVSVPVASPATQVSALNNVQVLTLGSRNGDVENNNQSQELEQTNESKGSNGHNGCNSPCGPAPRFIGGGSGRGSEGQENEATQVLVPIASPATQVTGLNNGQVLTLGSRNGDVENNNQSQELEQSNTSKGSTGGHGGCKPPCGPVVR